MNRSLWLLIALGACASPQPRTAQPNQLAGLTLGPARGVGGRQDPDGKGPRCDREPAKFPRVCKEVRLKPPEDAPLGQYMVTMSVSIATDGHVSDAQITEGAGAPFDDVARKAMAEFEFCPGRDRDDLAVACRITYRYVFVR